jgi:polyhydroxyalkanoate synthesis regulator phasin
MSDTPQPPTATTEPSPSKAETHAHGQENVANVVREKIQRGELSPQEARHLFEYLNKELDA